MRATIELNHYERELLYGYPYIVGRVNGNAIRAPLFTVPVRIDAEGGGYVISPDDEVIRFNSLPFRAEDNSEARDHALSVLTERTPGFPLDAAALREFVVDLKREVPDLEVDAALDGRLGDPPNAPNSGSFLRLIDQAAVFVAPTTSYFLTSDLERMAEVDESDVEELALGPFLYGAGSGVQAEFDERAEDKAAIYFPFQSNRAQRRVALLVDHPETKVVHLEGPPGTGKSLTIANLACHLAATGRTVLITSQKDQALRVVDEQLRKLELAQLPMTLLNRDATSRQELRDRLGRISKTRAALEVETEVNSRRLQLDASRAAYSDLQSEFETALEGETEFIQRERAVTVAQGLKRVIASWSFGRAKRRLRRTSPRASDILGEAATEARQEFLKQGVNFLGSSLELKTSAAERQDRQQIKEFEAVLRRDQGRSKNFSLFDRLKAQPERAAMLLKLLPVWIMRPDDVARLFPCEPGLFDVVIIDEASQVDLPSITPILFRGKKAVISGDTKQMQPRRFAFTQQAIATEAWQQAGMAIIDPNGWLDPVKFSLLSLGEIRAEESAFLNEHYRSLPPIISFSNERWYGGNLRIMTDESRKKFGRHDQPIVQLHRVTDGAISGGTQENIAEARALLTLLRAMLILPEYSEATIGVLCLFEEQVELLQDMIASEIEPELWEKHNLVVVNPDGFQGDERDVILYSLSYDANIMPKSAIAARQANQEHIQGMLNVAFTRARDEVHIFHSAPLDGFAFASGVNGTLTDWLLHCERVSRMPRQLQRGTKGRLGRADSIFEVEVADALRKLDFDIVQNFPSCGFFIDLVVERGGKRLAIECDGEAFHLDEHGELKYEDLERQAVLERAGWQVMRIPYRRWRENADHQVRRVVGYFGDSEVPSDQEMPNATEPRKNLAVSREGGAILNALREGLVSEETVLRRCREILGYKALGSRIRMSILYAAADLQRRGFISIEDGEYFLTSAGRSVDAEVLYGIRPYTPSRRRSSNWRGRRRW
jgi:very-short-patch-repair endonuclease